MRAACLGIVIGIAFTALASWTAAGDREFTLSGEAAIEQGRPSPFVVEAQASGGPMAAQARDEVVALLHAQTAAWSRGDLEAFCSSYADDAMFFSPSGVTRGRQAVLDRYRKRYPDGAAMGTLTLEPLEVRVGPGDSPAAVSVAAKWTLAYPDKPSLSGLTLIVFHRTKKGWRIVQDASM